MECPICGYDNIPGVDFCEECSSTLMQEDLPVPVKGVQRHIMSDPVKVLSPAAPVTVSASTSLAEGVRIMRERQIGCLLVTGGSGELEGIFTERDLLFRVADQESLDLETTTLAEVMTPRPRTLFETDVLALALHAMAVGHFRHIPIVDAGKKVTGIIALRDIINFIESQFRDIVTRKISRGDVTRSRESRVESEDPATD